MSPDTICCCGRPEETIWGGHASWCRVHIVGKAKSTAIHQAPPPPGSDMRDPHLLVDVRRYTDSLGNPVALKLDSVQQGKPINLGPRTHTVWVVLYEDKHGKWRTGSRAWQNGTQAYAHLGRLVADGKAARGRVESTQVTIDQEVK